MIEFTKRLKFLLDLSELDDRALSEKSGIEISLIQKYLRGNFFPSLKNAILIADGLETSLEYLCGRCEESEFTGKRPTPEFSEQFRIILKKRKLTRYRVRVTEGFSRKSLDDWFYGRSVPNLESAKRLAGYFETTMDDLVGR